MTTKTAAVHGQSQCIGLSFWPYGTVISLVIIFIFHVFFFFFLQTIDALFLMVGLNTMKMTMTCLYVGLFICFGHYTLAVWLVGKTLGRLGWLAFQTSCLLSVDLFVCLFFFIYLLYACLMISCIVMMLVSILTLSIDHKKVPLICFFFFIVILCFFFTFSYFLQNRTTEYRKD